MRLLSYNIHKGIGGSDRRYRLERILDVVRAEQPDLVCLQEVDYNCKRSNYDNQPAILADRLRAGAYVRRGRGHWLNAVASPSGPCR